MFNRIPMEPGFLVPPPKLYETLDAKRGKFDEDLKETLGSEDILN